MQRNKKVRKQLVTQCCPGMDASRYISTAPRLYEPRAYWEVFSIDSSNRDTIHSRCKSTQQHFTNTDDVPVTLTHILFDAIGYSLEERDAVNSPRTTECYRNTHSVLSEMQIDISLPWRRRLTTGFTPVISLPPLHNVNHHPMRYGRAHKPQSELGTPMDSTHSAAMINDFRWRFDFPVVTPAGNQPVLSLSSIPVPGFADALLEDGVTARTWCHQHYLASQWQDHQRSFCCKVPFGKNQLPRDAYGNGSYSGAWPVSDRPYNWSMPGEEWDDQKPHGMEYDDCLLREIGVLLSQSVYEDQLWASYQNKLADPQVRIANVGSSIATKIKGATVCQSKWWRDGAPLSLVSPTKTCALVIELAHPITLAPNEQIDFEIQAPLPWQNDNVIPEEPTVSPIYNYGVSFCGYASFLEGEIK